MITEHSAIMEPVRRLEVFTGAGRRRTWSKEDKARVVAEIVTSGDSVYVGPLAAPYFIDAVREVVERMAPKPSVAVIQSKMMSSPDARC